MIELLFVNGLCTLEYARVGSYAGVQYLAKPSSDAKHGRADRTEKLKSCVVAVDTAGEAYFLMHLQHDHRCALRDDI